MQNDIADKLARVREIIAGAAREDGRAPGAVTLIAVSKTQPWERVAQAIAAGQRHFGENTVQDAAAKLARCTAPDVVWHFIGHLQSNKAKHVPGRFAWLQSLDNLVLAQRLDRVAGEHGTQLNVLIEVNVSDDPRKHGVAPDALAPLVESLLRADLARLRLRGLMTIGPQTDDEKRLRAAFARLRSMRDACVERFGLRDFTELSMGMSGDLRAAVLEGATLVRVGTAIFGTRANT